MWVLTITKLWRFQNVEDAESRYSKERNWLRFRQLSKCIREAGSLEPGIVRFWHSVKCWVSVTRHFSQSLLSTSVPLEFGSCFCSQFLQRRLYGCSRVIYLICVTLSYPHSFNGKKQRWCSFFWRVHWLSEVLWNLPNISSLKKGRT